MENLFHGRTKLAYIYDLKGSLRKRLADVQPNINVSGSTTPLIVTASNLNSNANVLDSRAQSNLMKSNRELSTILSTNRPKFFVDSIESNSVLDREMFDAPDFEFGVQINEPDLYAPPVLLDQNLLNSIIDDALYLRVHSKVFLIKLYCKLLYILLI